MQALKAEIQSLTKDSSQKVGNFKVGLEADFRAKLTAEQELRSQIEEAKHKVTSGKSQNISREHLDTLYEHLLKKKYAIQEELSNLKRSLAALTATVRISEEPILPTAGKKFSLTLLAGCFGILIPVGTLLMVTIASLLHNRFYDITDVRESLHIPVLAAIPDKLVNLTPQRFQFLFRRAMRSVGLALSFAGDGAFQRTIVITSADRAEGTSTVSRELAAAYARSGRRVLLIDANLHYPSQGGYFGMPLDLLGLTDVLAQAVSLSQVSQFTSVPGLMLLTAGTPTVHFEEMVRSNSMEELLSSAYIQFDNVVIDTPPALVFPCAMSLASKVDTTILLIDQKYTSKRGARQAIRLLQKGGGKIGGAILNRVEVESNDSIEYEHLGGQNAMPSFRSQIHTRFREIRRFLSRMLRTGRRTRLYDRKTNLAADLGVDITGGGTAATAHQLQLPPPSTSKSFLSATSSATKGGKTEEFYELLGTFYQHMPFSHSATRENFISYVDSRLTSQHQPKRHPDDPYKRID